MFLFHFLNVFDSAYRNGFADGATVSGFLFILGWLFRVYSKFSGIYREFRLSFRSFCIRWEDGKAEESDIEEFTALVLRSGFLGKQVQNVVVSKMEMVRGLCSFHKLPASEALRLVAPELKAVIAGPSFSTLRVFLRHPWEAVKHVYH